MSICLIDSVSLWVGSSCLANATRDSQNVGLPHPRPLRQPLAGFGVLGVEARSESEESDGFEIVDGDFRLGILHQPAQESEAVAVDPLNLGLQIAEWTLDNPALVAGLKVA